MKRPALSFLLVLCFASVALGQTLTRESTPEPLRPWIDWTLYGHEAAHGVRRIRVGRCAPPPDASQATGAGPSSGRDGNFAGVTRHGALP